MNGNAKTPQTPLGHVDVRTFNWICAPSAESPPSCGRGRTRESWSWRLTSDEEGIGGTQEGLLSRVRRGV
eukprot:scaffold250052_cov30-Tisochrysis_lutea.AAC.4